MLNPDTGYIALLTFLVAVPAAAIGAAVLDRMVKRRRDGVIQRPLSPVHAFPVISDASSKPIPVQSLPVDRH